MINNASSNQEKKKCLIMIIIVSLWHLFLKLYRKFLQLYVTFSIPKRILLEPCQYILNLKG